MSYQLAKLKVTYNAKLKDHLADTIKNLKTTLSWTNISLPEPARLPRRSWRVFYLTAPFVDKIRKKHYIFHDWRYSFTFDNIQDPRPIMSSILGSMSKDTSCVVAFAWHYPGQAATPDAQDLIQTGYNNYIKRNRMRREQATTGWRSQFRYGNFKQYVPDEYR